MKKLNERLFDDESNESEVLELLSKVAVPYERICWDDYDNSLELYGVPPDYRLSEEAKKAIFDAGFAVCFVNHIDKWETHYTRWNNTNGWRVSYPHKRNDGDPDIWLEKDPPKGWEKFKTSVKTKENV